MDRRKFIQNAFLGAASLTLSWKSLAGTPDWEWEIDPYRFDLYGSSFQQNLKNENNDLPTVISIHSRQRTPSKTKWGVGEGRNNSIDSNFRRAVNRHNNRVAHSYFKIQEITTPVFLLNIAKQGDIVKNVYGQFLSNRVGNFSYGIIRGHNHQYYITHPAFRQIFTEEYGCYGLPSADFEEIRCGRCNEKYIRQYFKPHCGSSIIELYAQHDNCGGKGHTCAGVPSSSPLRECKSKRYTDGKVLIVRH